MLKISKMTDYAVVVLTALAMTAPTGAESGSAADVARRTGLPLTTVAKVLKLLAKAGLVTSARGAAGGYRLARTADEIGVADIIAAIDGPVLLTDCVGSDNHSCTRSACASRGRWDEVNRTVLSALASITLTKLLPLPSPFMMSVDALADAQQSEVRHG